MHSNQLKIALNRISNIPEQELRYYEQLLEWRSVKKGQVVLQSGDVCTEIFYCASGAFRMFYSTQDGLDMNKSFFLENTFFTSYSSLILQFPSDLSIQALEFSEIAVISKATLESLYERHR